MPMFISGFELYADELKNSTIMELYEGYWVLVDTRSAGLCCEVLSATNLEAAVEEAGKCAFLDGSTFDAQSAKLVYSKGDIHIFEINK